MASRRWKPSIEGRSGNAHRVGSVPVEPTDGAQSPGRHDVVHSRQTAEVNVLRKISRMRISCTLSPLTVHPLDVVRLEEDRGKIRPQAVSGGAAVMSKSTNWAPR